MSSVDQTSVAFGSSVSSLTWNHTCSAGATGLVVYAQIGGPTGIGSDLPTITYNGVGLSVATSPDGSATYFNPSGSQSSVIGTWFLRNPSVGTFPIHLTFPVSMTQVVAYGVSTAGTTVTSGATTNFFNAPNNNDIVVKGALPSNYLTLGFTSGLFATDAGGVVLPYNWTNSNLDTQVGLGNQAVVTLGASNSTNTYTLNPLNYAPINFRGGLMAVLALGGSGVSNAYGSEFTYYSAEGIGQL